MEGETRASALRDLAHNVGVNVIANLIAAAIIYLGGVLIGLFPRDPKGIALATGGLLFMAALAFGAAGGFMRWPNRAKTTAAFFFLVGAGLLVTGLAGIQIEQIIPLWGQIIWGVSAIAGGVYIGWMSVTGQLGKNKD